VSTNFFKNFFINEMLYLEQVRRFLKTIFSNENKLFLIYNNAFSRRKLYAFDWTFYFFNFSDWTLKICLDIKQKNAMQFTINLISLKQKIGRKRLSIFRQAKNRDICH